MEKEKSRGKVDGKRYGRYSSITTINNVIPITVNWFQMSLKHTGITLLYILCTNKCFCCITDRTHGSWTSFLAKGCCHWCEVIQDYPDSGNLPQLQLVLCLIWFCPLLLCHCCQMSPKWWTTALKVWCSETFIRAKMLFQQPDLAPQDSICIRLSERLLKSRWHTSCDTL